MISSIDGRLLVDRWTPLADGRSQEQLLARYDEVAERFGADGWIVGRRTMEEFAEGRGEPVTAEQPIPRETYFAPRKHKLWGIALDPQGKVHYGRNDERSDDIVAILGTAVSDDYLAELRSDGISYLFAGPNGRDLSGALATLRSEFGLKTLLLEGGGVTNGTFLRAGLIDEISVLMYPGIDGLSGVPSIFESVGEHDERPANGKTLRHLATETLADGLVWLHYRVEPIAGGDAP